MSIKLYGFDKSPVTRGTLFVVKALGIEFEWVEMNTVKGDQFAPEFLKLNPLHTVPVIEDGDFVLWDSHAINAYLVGKYGKDDSLYPKDLQKRAVVDQRLFFDCGILFPRMGVILLSLFKQGAKTINKEKATALVEAYNLLETLLERSTYVAGEELTIADFSIIATISTANLLVPIASNRYPKIADWITKMQALPYYNEVNQKPLDELAAILKTVLV